jgi:hypothetical protein
MLRDKGKHMLIVVFNVEGRGIEFVINMNIMIFVNLKPLSNNYFFKIFVNNHMVVILLFLNLTDVKCYKVIKIDNVKFNFPKHESKVKN